MMNTKVANYLIRRFESHSLVCSEDLLTMLFYVEKSTGLQAVGADDELLKLLSEEEFSDETSQFLKQLVVSFAAETENLSLFASAIRVLQAFNDPRLDPFLSAWLDKHLRNLLHESAAVSQLLFALERSGALERREKSFGITTVELNIETAKSYLTKVTGITYPW